MIYRRRQGETQAEAAERLGMPESSYCCAELDQQHGWEIPEPKLGPLWEYEKCLIFRLRRGMSQAALARAIGRSRYWVGMMERGEVNDYTLRRYWKSRMVKLVEA